MNIITCGLSVAAAGAIGGLANSLQTGERFVWPRYDEDLKVRTMGWAGNILVGSIASVVVWTVYSPLASFDLNGGDFSRVHLPLFQLGSSVIVGLSGGKILSSLAQHKADQVARDNLAALSKKLNKTKK